MIGKRTIAVGLVAGLLASAASAQFPSVKSLPRSLPTKTKPAEKTERVRPPKERRSVESRSVESRTGSDPDSTSASTGSAWQSQGITGPLHQKYLGQIVFTKADRTMTAISEADITRDFAISDDIYFRVYVDKPGLANFPGPDPAWVNQGNKWLHMRYRVIFRLGGQVFDMPMRAWGTAEEHESWTTWRGEFLTSDPGLPGGETFAEFLSRAERKGLIKPGRNAIEVDIVPTMIVNDGRGIDEEKLRGAPVAKGSFTLTVGPGGVPKRDRRVCGWQRAGSMPALEQQILSYARSVWTKPSAPPVEARLTHAGWTINRHPLSGAVVSRRIDVALVGRHAEYCEIQGYSYVQPYVGGGFSASGQEFTGAEARSRYIPCSCIG